jgi:hypothetical protein
MRWLALLLPLTGCSALMVGELGYTGKTTGPLHGISGALHAGFGIDEDAEEGKPTVGLGFSGRIRGYGREFTTFEPGLHAYVMMDQDAVSFYARAVAFAGLSASPAGVGIVFSPTLQPGMLLCPYSREGWCVSVSAPLGYDFGTDQNGPVLGFSVGIGWGNVIADP